MAESIIYFNGRLLPAGQAGLSVYDAGFLHGFSAFTTMLARNGRVFGLDRHIRRVLDTADLLGFGGAAEEGELRTAVSQVLSANHLTDARGRITISPGSIRDGEATVLVTAEPLPEYPAWWYTEGLLVVVSSFHQIPGHPTFGYKTGCYAERVLALREAAAKGAQEALWYTPGQNLAEACFCNVFLVADGVVRTPPRDTPVLPGVVRATVIELCDELGLACDAETPLTLGDMLDAEEVFLTASTSGIRPVRQVEQHVVGDGAAGGVTGRLIEAYRRRLDAECPPA